MKRPHTLVSMLTEQQLGLVCFGTGSLLFVSKASGCRLTHSMLTFLAVLAPFAPLACCHVLDVLQGLGEDVTKPKSRLERDKEAAAAAAAKAGSTSDVRKSTSSVRSKVAEAWQGQGLESVLHKRKSKLEQDKENAAAAAAAANISPKELNKPVAATRSGYCCCICELRAFL